jgi:hypothetical protein
MQIHPNEIPSMNNIYDNIYWEKVKADEQIKSNDLYKKSNNPFETGIVPKPAYADMFLPLNDFNTQNSLNIKNNNEVVSSLSGQNINIENFSHNNMQPFFKGRVTQNTDFDVTSARLDNNTGIDKFYRHKKEVECFFKPTAGYGSVCSMKNYDEYYKDHLVSSRLRNNEFPIKSVKVGPGLNQGYNSKGIGGFQQTDQLDYAMPKSLDELRSKINQKNNCFQIPFKSPVKGVDQRGLVEPPSKNKPETSYEQAPEQWIKTTGANLRNTERAEQYIKPTTRVETHTDYKGIAKDNDIMGLGNNDDYGKKSILVYNTERQKTEVNTVVSNPTSIVKAIIAPVLDALRLTQKEYTIDAPRAGGNVQAQIPSKATLYDPITGVMKTTVKETTIHDYEPNNLSGPEETYSSLQDQAKTTVKETTIHDYEPNNLSGPEETYSSLQDQAKTTVKETTIHDQEINNLTGQGGTYVPFDDNLRTTIKETTPYQDTTRNIGAKVYKVYSYDPNLAVKTTIKETTIKPKSEYGFLGGLLEGLIGAYRYITVDVKNTQKQFTSDYENYGTAGSKTSFNQPSREAEYNAEIDGTREMLLIHAGHTPNGGGNYKSVDKNDVNMSTRKIMEDNVSQRTVGNISKIYQTTVPSIDTCEITKPQILPNANQNWLDPSLLEPLKSNELNISINPINPKCKF